MFKIILKIAKILLILILIYFVFWGYLITHIKSNRLKGFTNISLRTNFERIYLAIVNYTNEHSGKMPDSQNWADALMDNYNLIREGDFLSFMSHPSFGIFYNKSLSGKQYSDLKDNCVVLFGGKGRRNATGGKYEFYDFISKGESSFLVTSNGDIYIYNYDSKKVERLKDSFELNPEDLIWDD